MNCSHSVKWYVEMDKVFCVWFNLTLKLPFSEEFPEYGIYVRVCGKYGSIVSNNDSKGKKLVFGVWQMVFIRKIRKVQQALQSVHARKEHLTSKNRFNEWILKCSIRKYCRVPADCCTYSQALERCQQQRWQQPEQLSYILIVIP